MRRRNFTFFCYMIALLVAAIMIAPEAEARFVEMTMVLRATGSVKAAINSAVVFNTVPEPSRAVLLLLGIATMTMRRQRRYLGPR